MAYLMVRSVPAIPGTPALGGRPSGDGTRLEPRTAQMQRNSCPASGRGPVGWDDDRKIGQFAARLEFFHNLKARTSGARPEDRLQPGPRSAVDTVPGWSPARAGVPGIAGMTRVLQ